MSAGVKGNLTESQGYILANLIVTGTTVLLAVYFLVWQTYVMRADVIISSVLLVIYGLDGVLAVSTLARLARSVPPSLIFILAILYQTSSALTDERAFIDVTSEIYFFLFFVFFVYICQHKCQTGRKLQYLVSNIDNVLHCHIKRPAYVLGSIYFD